MAVPETNFPVRTLTEDDWADFLDVDSHAFGMTVEAELDEAERELHEPGRGIGAFDGSTLAGIASAYSLDLTVPGAVLPAAGVTWVGVLPTYRRRGVLRSLMTHQLYDVHARGQEAVAVLWASEPSIYGRFGYGLSSRAFSLRVPRNPRALRDDAPADPSLRLRIVASEDWKLVADVYDTAARARPGMLGRDARWHRRAVRDLPTQRHGRSALRCVVAEDDAGVRGYARYSTKPDWTPAGPKGVVSVREVITVDEPARATLFRYLFDLDLMGTVELWNVPVDDPLLHWLADIRVTQPTWMDVLYTRLVDVPRALGGRAYALPVDVVLAVSDPLCPWNDGRWRLVGDTDGASCERTDGPADIGLSVTDLGAAYLGGTALADLARAGRVNELRAGTLAHTSLAFGASPQPWCPVVF